jgi:hypothetical protein
MADPWADTDPALFVFPGMRTKRPLSNMAMLVLLRRMRRDDLTAHGFLSPFRDEATKTEEPIVPPMPPLAGQELAASKEISDGLRKLAQHASATWIMLCCWPNRQRQGVATGRSLGPPWPDL